MRISGKETTSLDFILIGSTEQAFQTDKFWTWSHVESIFFEFSYQPKAEIAIKWAVWCSCLFDERKDFITVLLFPTLQNSHQVLVEVKYKLQSRDNFYIIHWQWHLLQSTTQKLSERNSLPCFGSNWIKSQLFKRLRWENGFGLDSCAKQQTVHIVPSCGFSWKYLKYTYDFNRREGNDGEDIMHCLFLSWLWLIIVWPIYFFQFIGKSQGP